MKIVAISVFTLMAGVVPTTAQEAKVFRNESGQIRFESDQKAEVWTDTGLTVTAEASRYPEAVKQLIAENLEMVPAEIVLTESRLIGFWTWEKMSRAKTMAAKEGTKIILRPASETEAMAIARDRMEKNPFVLFVSLAMFPLIIGNLAMRGRKSAYAVVTTAAVAGNDSRRWFHGLSAVAGALLILSVVVAAY